MRASLVVCVQAQFHVCGCVRVRLPTGMGVQVLAHIRGYADAAQDPQLFPTSPALAAPAALARAQMKQSEVDYWEINQAFSVVDLVNQQLLGLDPSRCAFKTLKSYHPLACP